MTAALEVEGVTVRFGGHLALRDVTLAAEPGQVTGLIGPNVAGKTTLFNVITGLRKPQRGQVRIDGRSVTGLAPHRRARLGLARTFQRLELFALLTVRENLTLAASQRRPGRPDVDPDELLEFIGLADLAESRADELPTGKARLVELGRALATRPQVLLLDEPASGQDDAETEAFRRVLIEVAARGVAVVLVEHDVQLVMRTCAVVHVLDFGALLATGTPAEVQADAKVRAAYLGALGAGSMEGVA